MRVAAYLIDYVILMATQFVIYSVMGISVFGATSLDLEANEIFTTTIGLVTYALVIVGSIAYFVLMESSSKQGTLGKMAVGIIVTDTNGNRITWMRALGRYFAKILYGIVLLIGYIMVAFTERKQGLHDMICSTLVVKRRPGEGSVDPTVFD